MTKKDSNNCISYINLCQGKLDMEQRIKSFFENQNYSVLSYLKELNNYVIITTDYPLDRANLLKILDPYRKFCDTILLIVVFEQEPVAMSFPWNLTEFGISDILFVNRIEQILEHVQTHFNRYIAINRLINNEGQEKSYHYRQTFRASLN